MSDLFIWGEYWKDGKGFFLIMIDIEFLENIEDILFDFYFHMWLVPLSQFALCHFRYESINNKFQVRLKNGIYILGIYNIYLIDILKYLWVRGNLFQWH